jgi:hypothetical protein
MAVTKPGYESPEALKRLQLLFDEIWDAVVASGSPHAAPEVAVASRDRLALLVVKHIGRNHQDSEKMKREILEAFNAGT